MKTYPKMKESEIMEIGKIPMEWEISKLKHVIKKGNQGVNTAIDQVEYADSGYPLIKSKDIQKGLQIENADIISEESFKKIPIDFKPKKNDILLSNIGNLGNAVLIEKNTDIAIAWNVFKIVISEKINPKFLTYFLNSDFIRSMIKLKSSMNTMPFIPKSEILNLQILNPSKYEQEQISKYLDKKMNEIDLKINKNQNLIELLEEKYETVIEQGINDGFNHHRKEKWKLIRIKNISNVITKGTTPTTINKEFKKNGISFIKVENIKNNLVIDLSNCSFIDEDTQKILHRSKLFEDDVLVAIAGATFGKVGIVTKEMIPANTNQAISIIRPNKLKIHPKWLTLCIKSSSVQNYFKKLIVQSAQPNLSLEDLGNTEITLPNLEEQIEIIKIIENKIKNIEIIQNKIKFSLNSLKEYRQSLISSVIMGKIDVREAVA
jgi:type I restriction enzyme, S subunit